MKLEEFAQLIGKTPSTVVALEVGRLRLSEATAAVIAQKTGVNMPWLIHGDPEGPIPDFRGREWTKQTFERVQAGELADLELESILGIADQAWAVYRNHLLGRTKDSMLRAILLNRFCSFVEATRKEFADKVDAPAKGPPLSMIPPSEMKKVLKGRKPKPRKSG